jgi:chromosome partitioning protein
MRRIAVINQKGGVGKTTTAVNLGAALAHLGRRVCVVDVDAQANLSLHLDIESRSGSPSIYTVLTGATSFPEAIHPTSTPGLVAVPANLDLSGAELELASAIGRESLMRDAVEAWETAEKEKGGRSPVDYVIFDCPPSLGLLSVNALAAADEVVLTLQTEFFALQGMSKLVEVVQILRRRLNPGLVITGILPCLYDSRLRLAREVLGEIRTYFPGEVFSHPIRTNVKLAEAPSYGQTIFEYAPESNGAEDYLRLARSMIAMESRDAELAGLPEPPDDRTVMKALRAAAAVARAREEEVPAAKTAEAPEAAPQPEPDVPREAPKKAPPEELKDVVLEPQPSPSQPSQPAPAEPVETAEAAKQVEEAPADKPRPKKRNPGAGSRIVRAKDLPALPSDAFDSLTQYVRDPE